ncbi:hypothetical protein [Streptomyces globosus]|uniref:hypothetical protein n=1 Tax=Streptomyces globosus TaxID=68209 RepID=UPI0031D8C225
MPDADSYEWHPAPCPECADPAARLAPGDSDRADILLCSRCLVHGRLPYRDPAEIRACLPFGVRLAMRGEVLHIGVPVTPHGLNAYTRAVVDLATERGFVAVWRPSRRRHEVIVAAPRPDGAWGWIEVGARSGKILRAAVYPHGRGRPGMRAAGSRAVRQLVERLPIPGAAARPDVPAGKAADGFS